MFLVSFRQDSEYRFWSKDLISDRNLLISSTFRSHCLSKIFSALMDCNTSSTVEHQVLWFDWWSCNNSSYIICSELSGCNPNRRHQNLINNSFCRISRGQQQHSPYTASVEVCFSPRAFSLWTLYAWLLIPLPAFLGTKFQSHSPKWAVFVNQIFWMGQWPVSGSPKIYGLDFLRHISPSGPSPWSVYDFFYIRDFLRWTLCPESQSFASLISLLK